MAIYHLSVKIHSRSTGASAVARAAYRAREKLVDERTGESHDYSRREDLDGAEILDPREAPEWARDRGQLWNQVEAVERRKDAQLARELEIGLPVELTPEQRRELVREFLEDECVDRGMVADVAFHGGDGPNPHVHVLLTTRQIGEDGFGQKERSWNDRQLLQHWREQWAERANAALERGDFQAAAEFDRAPPVHLGKSLRIFLRTGEVTERLERAEEVGDHNEERRTLRGRIRVLHSGATEPEGVREAVERNMGTPGGRP